MVIYSYKNVNCSVVLYTVIREISVLKQTIRRTIFSSMLFLYCVVQVNTEHPQRPEIVHLRKIDCYE